MLRRILRWSCVAAAIADSRQPSKLGSTEVRAAVATVIQAVVADAAWEMRDRIQNALNRRIRCARVLRNASSCGADERSDSLRLANGACDTLHPSKKKRTAKARSNRFDKGRSSRTGQPARLGLLLFGDRKRSIRPFASS
jgi:hypothetical protein